MVHRFCIAAAVLASSALVAAPVLTTIQDVLYKADGTRFNGSVTISWNSFQAADNSTIVTQSTTVKVVDGVLRVQLAPTTAVDPPVTYTVTYTSDGRLQSQETWSVPASSTPVRVRDVRVATAPQPPAGETGSNPIPETLVTGLIADLGARPVKGPGYSAAAAAVIDATGMLAAATGTPSDCVRVDGSSGPCGGPTPSFVDSEALSGIVDGANTTFALSSAPQPASSLFVFRNGILQKAGLDFTQSGTGVQFVAGATPQPGDTLIASFRTSAADSTGRPFSSPEVLCSGTGGSTANLALTNIGNCAIPAGVLLPGDRIEIRFDLAHTGTAAFSFEVGWGATTLVHRDAAGTDALATGRIDGSILPTSAHFSIQTWGTVLPLSAAVAAASDSYASGLTIPFLAKVTVANDSIQLATFSVVRIP